MDYRIICAGAFFALLAGCSAQGRGGKGDSDFELQVERETYLHGGRGYDIARTFNSKSFREKMKESPPDERIVVDEFYTVRVARDPVRRDLLSDAGFTRRRVDRQTANYFFEFFDTGWALVAYLNAQGDLYTVGATGKAESRGKCQIDDALIMVYGAQPGQAFNMSDYDEARRKAAVTPGLGPRADTDPDREATEIRGRSPRERGVVLRTQRENQPIVELRRYLPVEIRTLSETYRKDTFDDSREKELQLLREQRRGTEAPDGPYGGMEFKDGQPVDQNGNPLKRGDAGK